MSKPWLGQPLDTTISQTRTYVHIGGWGVEAGLTVPLAALLDVELVSPSAARPSEGEALLYIASISTSRRKRVRVEDWGYHKG